MIDTSKEATAAWVHLLRKETLASVSVQNRAGAFIEALAAENARLRDALKPFATACRTNTVGADSDDLILRVPVEVKSLRRAHAAWSDACQAPYQEAASINRGNDDLARLNREQAAILGEKKR